MPKTIIERIENFIVEPFEGTLPKHIKQFCSGRQIVTRKTVDNLKAAGEIVLKQIKGINSLKLRKKFNCSFKDCTFTFPLKLLQW